MYTIYGLLDPDSGSLRYVGFTSKSPRVRLREHVKDVRRTHRRAWIRSLVAKGKRPVVEALDVFPTRDAANEAEVEWIAMARSWGADLVNHTDGGDAGSISDAARKKISAATLGRVKRPESIEKMRATQVAMWTPEMRADASERAKKRRASMSEEAKANSAAHWFGAVPRTWPSPVRSADFIERLRERMRGKKYGLGYRHTDEAKLKMSAKSKGNKRCLGRKFSEETLAKMRESQRKRHARERLKKEEMP